MVLFTFLFLGLLAVLLLGVIARVAWLLLHRQRPSFLLAAWLCLLVLCAASFLPSDTQYAAAFVALKGPGKHWKYLEETAATKNSVLLLDTLTWRGAPVDHSTILVAAREGSDNVLRHLLTFGIPVNGAFLAEKTTALHLAVQRNHYLTTELLLRAGAQIDILDARGKSPLDYARMQSDERMMTILLRNQIVSPN